MTSSGGASGGGTVYDISKSGWLSGTLHSFVSSTDGSNRAAG